MKTKTARPSKETTLADRIRQASPVARRIVTEGIFSYESDQVSPTHDEAVAHWVERVGGPSQDDLFRDFAAAVQAIKAGRIHPLDQEGLPEANLRRCEALAGGAYALGVAVGLLLRPEAFAMGDAR